MIIKLQSTDPQSLGKEEGLGGTPWEVEIKQICLDGLGVVGNRIGKDQVG